MNTAGKLKGFDLFETPASGELPIVLAPNSAGPTEAVDGDGSFKSRSGELLAAGIDRSPRRIGKNDEDG